MKKENIRQSGMRPRVIILSVLLAALTASLICAAGAVCISLERIGEESAGAVSAAAVGIGVFCGCIFAAGRAEQRKGIYALAAGSVMAAILAVAAACAGSLFTAGELRSLLGCAAGCVCALAALMRSGQSRRSKRRIYKK